MIGQNFPPNLYLPYSPLLKREQKAGLEEEIKVNEDSPSQKEQREKQRHLISDTSYTFGERIFRTAVFQIGVAHNCLEKFLINLISMCLQKTCRPNVLDPRRAEKGLALWKRLGSTEFTAIPQDGQAKIQGVFWRAETLENILKSHGAKWEKIVINDDGEEKEILAIIPPKNSNLTWQALENDIKKFQWPHRQVTTIEGDTLDVIVTCSEAEELMPEDFNTKIFLHSNSASVSYIMLKRRASFYIGMKQDLCFYDPRGTLNSTGVASEGGYYNDILAVYEKVRNSYSAEQIWVSGACLGCSAAAFLKAKTEESFNLILENGFVDFKRDFVGNENLIARIFAKKYWKGLFAKNNSPSLKIQETGFSIESMWKDVKPSGLIGKIVMVGVENDQRLPPIVRNRNLSVAKKVSETVYPILFSSPDRDPHFDRYFNHSRARRSFIHIFKAT